MIRVLVADDEALARDELIYLLKEQKTVQVIGEASNGEEALERALELKPDVVFLDIYMPKLDGLTVAKKLLETGIEFMVVFATAYDQHAIQAFEVNAVDYLLKPFDEERVRLTIERLMQRSKEYNPEKLSSLISQLLGDNIQSFPPKVSKLAVQNEESLILIDPNEIVYIYREGREVYIRTTESTYESKYTLQVLEEKLSSYPFYRTHRSYLANLTYAKELVPWFHGAYNLIMDDEKQSRVPVSRAYIKGLRDALEL